MTPFSTRSALLYLLAPLALLASSAHAIVTCPRDTAHPMAPAMSAANDVARRLAGLEIQGEADHATYSTAVNDGWQAYQQTFRQPLANWAVKEVRAGTGGTVFYPFSGPDLPSVLTITPGASRYVMIADQYATPYFDPFALKEPDRSRVISALGEAWASFGQRGFFVTTELNKGGGRKYGLSPSMIMLAFAARMGYEVRAISPICLDATDRSIRTQDGRKAYWNSVRLELRKDGRDVIVDYVQQDLSDRGLRKNPLAHAFVENLARGPVLFKAASHLPQMPAFTLIRNAILTHTPLLVQDETGLEYDAMAERFNVRLYGAYIGAHRLFKEAINPSLIKAYKDHARDVRPLEFKIGYDKDAGSALQVAIRK